MAIQPKLSREARRAREIEAHGYQAQLPKTNRRFCTWPDSLDSIDPVSVGAQKRYVEKMEPEWIERVKREWEMYRDEVSTIFWSELPPETVRAILEILRARGEIDTRGFEV